MNELGLSDWEALFLHPENWRMIGVGGQEEGCAKGVAASRRRWSVEHAHHHPAREMMLCVKGQGFFGLAGKLYRCRPATLFVIAPETPHDDRYPGSARGMEHLWIRLLNTRIFLSWLRVERGRLQQRHSHLRVFSLQELGLSASYIDDMDEEASAAYQKARLRLLAGAAGLTLLKRVEKDADRPPHKPVTLPQRVTQAICHHIDETAGKGVTLDFLAHFSGYNKYYLHRLFRQHTGMTVHQYVDRCRRKRVQQLQDEEQTNGAIADALGFSCTAAYLRWRRTKMR